MPYSDEHIENYLRGNLSTSERSAFEEKLKTDKDLVERLDFLRTVEAAARIAGSTHLAEKFTEIDRQLDAPEKTHPVPSKTSSRWMAIAATFLVLVAAVWYFTTGGGSSSPADLFAEYFEPFPNIVAPALRGEPDDREKALGELMQAYDRGEYATVEQIARDQVTLSDTMQFYQGVSLLSLNQLEQATDLFENLSQQEGFRFQEASQWYLALVELQKENLDGSISQLNTIVERENHRYNQEAADLLEAMRE